MTYSANERQVGGTHYMSRDYQHWDFVTDIKLPYLLGVATKYVSRHKEKNGKQDLEKSLHYIDKAEERGVNFAQRMRRGSRMNRLEEFANQHPNWEALAIEGIVIGDYPMAKTYIGYLISGYEQEIPTPAWPA